MAIISEIDALGSPPGSAGKHVLREGKQRNVKEKFEPRPDARVSRGRSVSSDLATTLVKT